MSKERNIFKQAEERMTIYARDKGICQACGEPVSMYQFNVAHRIANTISNRRRYGDEVIDHPLNKATTHPGRCNDAINCGFRPDDCKRIIEAIRKSKESL